LFEPNVLGTVELIKFAVTGRMKRFEFVSSLAVALDSPILLEGDDIRRVRPRYRLESGYASGYTASKWASEILLREAHERWGLPVDIFRCDMILPHRHYAGQINLPDMFSRLIFSLIATRIAPVSFYERGQSDERPRAHFDGLPVDFIATATAAIAAAKQRGFNVYHVVNPHEDGLSLDQFVDWMILVGFPIERVSDYDDWLTRFRAAIMGLPEKAQNQSSLALLSQLQVPAAAIDGSVVTADNFVGKLQSLDLGPTCQIPHLTRQYMTKCFNDLVHLKLVAPPNAMGVAELESLGAGQGASA